MYTVLFDAPEYIGIAFIAVTIFAMAFYAYHIIEGRKLEKELKEFYSQMEKDFNNREQEMQELLKELVEANNELVERHKKLKKLQNQLNLFLNIGNRN